MIGCHGRDRMVVGFTVTITTNVVSLNPTHGEVDSINTTLCDKVCQYLPQVGGFQRVLWFPPPIKLTATIELKYC
jgi:hypothetical protein